ncbi:hypothetical protein BSL78_20032 [Apostichopus japonicus]|uniref:Uncharacterized protein n=1 Tax=Stichopus japonicus TaxID=307972 RepID=A0A2G8K512_STIJA|nr:hypothetical protein BSL78_20032 [Apostichopus japonicus]
MKAEMITRQSAELLNIVGKQSRAVPVLMTNELAEASDLLYHSKEAGLLGTDPYIVATLHSEGHIRGPGDIGTHARNYGVIHPGYVTPTSLIRKHIATVCQIMNLKDNGLDIIARFMEHDTRTHREHYRLLDQTLQVAKVSKVLFNIENGNLQYLVGKSLDEIQIQPDEGNNTFFLLTKVR